MMINKRLISTVENSKKYIVANVVFQWISLLANMMLMGAIVMVLGTLYEMREGTTNLARASITLTGATPKALSTMTSSQIQTRAMIVYGIMIFVAVCVRFICTILNNRMSYLSSKAVKKTLREKIFHKLLKLGSSYGERIQTSEIVQVAVEGVDQLEIYFGAYLPQFFYAMLAPLTLFVAVCFINVWAAVVLFICVPLIPVSIAVVQTWAKKLLSKYWGQYTALGDTFLENLQGLTTLKIYQADGFKNEEMNQESEKFRKITMKVLTMQLNSITIMDLVAYGGAALGMIVAVSQMKAGHIGLTGCLFIILLSADFFIPMRQLGSFFHITMNGMAASDKIFKLLDLPETQGRKKKIENDTTIVCKNVDYSYDGEREILHHVNMKIDMGKFTAIIGESGSGKSTIAGILTGKNKGYEGSLTIGGQELKEVDEASLLEHMTYIGYQSYLFKGTVKENLLMGFTQKRLETFINEEQVEAVMWSALEQVKLAEFIREEGGLEMLLQEKASNLSGGQCQRLALARALLHDSEIYIFDEATSNIDAVSEDDIIEEICELAKNKTVIMISHRLANVVSADRVYEIKNGVATEINVEKIGQDCEKQKDDEVEKIGHGKEDEEYEKQK